MMPLNNLKADPNPDISPEPHRHQRLGVRHGAADHFLRDAAQDGQHLGSAISLTAAREPCTQVIRLGTMPAGHRCCAGKR